MGQLVQDYPRRQHRYPENPRGVLADGRAEDLLHRRGPVLPWLRIYDYRPLLRQGASQDRGKHDGVGFTDVNRIRTLGLLYGRPYFRCTELPRQARYP